MFIFIFWILFINEIKVCVKQLPKPSVVVTMDESSTNSASCGGGRCCDDEIVGVRTSIHIDNVVVVVINIETVYVDGGSSCSYSSNRMRR